MTDSEIVGQRYRLKMQLVREIVNNKRKTPNLTFGKWVETTWGVGGNNLPRVNRGSDKNWRIDLDDLIWCWRKATGKEL